MNQNTNVNLIPKFPFSGNLYFSQYDVGRVATINLVEDGSAYTIPSGATVKIQATKPSGLGFSVDCTYSGSVVTVVSTETMTNEYGRFPCELRIESGDVLLGTTNFTFNVEKSPHPDGTTDGTAESVVSEITAIINTFVDETLPGAIQTVIDEGNVEIDRWLDEHPEATTTVQDGSLTEAKFTDSLKLKTIKDYVTPEMFEAKGDGITDDAAAINIAFDSGFPVKFSPKTYLVKSVLNVAKTPLIDGNGATIDVQLNTPSDAGYGAIRALGNSAHSGTKRISNLKIEINTPSATSGDFVAMQFNGYDVFMDNVDIYIPSTSVNWHGLFCINDRTVLSNVRIENLTAGNHQGGAFWVRGNLSDAHVFCVNCVFISMAKDETVAFYGKSDGSTTVRTTLVNCVIQRQHSENFIADWTMAVYNNSSLLAKNCVIDSYTTGADCCKTAIRVGGTDVNDASNAVFENCKITASATVCLVSGPNTGTHGFNKENRVAFNQCSISCNVPVIGRFHDYGQTGKAMPGLPTEFNGCDIVCEEIVFDSSNTNSTTQTCAIRDSRVEINNALYIFGALYQNNYMFIVSNSIVIGNALTYEIRTNALATTSQSTSAPPVTPALKTVINSCYNDTALTELRAGRL